MDPIRINLSIDPIMDQELFQYFSKIGSRRRAGEARNLAAEGLRLKLSGLNLMPSSPVIIEKETIPPHPVKEKETPEIKRNEIAQAGEQEKFLLQEHQESRQNNQEKQGKVEAKRKSFMGELGALG
jgi:hypothetical protein